MAKSLIILRGLPGSGKSTFAKLFNAPICCADDYLMVNGKYVWTQPGVARAHMLCEAKCETLMRDNTPVIVVANTCVKPRDMKVYVDQARRHGYKVFTVIVENRHGGESEHNVSNEVMANMEKNFSVKLI